MFAAAVPKNNDVLGIILPRISLRYGITRLSRTKFNQLFDGFIVFAGSEHGIELLFTRFTQVTLIPLLRVEDIESCRCGMRHTGKMPLCTMAK